MLIQCIYFDSLVSAFACVLLMISYVAYVCFLSGGKIAADDFQGDFLDVKYMVLYFKAFELQHTQHFHIPLTWNPYGYSTYKGS